MRMFVRAYRPFNRIVRKQKKKMMQVAQFLGIANKKKVFTFSAIFNEYHPLRRKYFLAPAH